jgi:hypothetical protein
MPSSAGIPLPHYVSLKTLQLNVLSWDEARIKYVKYDTLTPHESLNSDQCGGTYSV